MSSRLTRKVASTLVISHWIRLFEQFQSSFRTNRWISELTDLVLLYSKLLIRFTTDFYDENQLESLKSKNAVTFNEEGDILTFNSSQRGLIYVVPTDLVLDFTNPTTKNDTVFIKFTKLDNSENYCNFGFIDANESTKVSYFCLSTLILSQTFY